MYTIPNDLPHEAMTGLFGMPRRWLGLAALAATGLIGWLSGGAPSLPTMILIAGAALLASAELLPARRWQARGWLRTASILAVIAAATIAWTSRPQPKIEQYHPCGCLNQLPAPAGTWTI
ncbi:MAG TPA: hypothetical protein VD886_00635 [Herpetosiphonaceae bacterium]|nr:hypothetical protein [Herpetosiphonaceae bacterium]